MIYIADSLITENVNKVILDLVKKRAKWTYAKDYLIKNASYKVDQLPQEFSNNGLIHSLDPSNKEDLELISLADLIFLTCFNELEKNFLVFKNKKVAILSQVWNYYKPCSCGVNHKDLEESKPNEFSMVYFLNTCDGGLHINNQFIKSEAGKFVVFNPSNLHRGTGPVKDKERFVLNILFDIN